jgi:hypothetical protein
VHAVLLGEIVDRGTFVKRVNDRLDLVAGEARLMPVSGVAQVPPGRKPGWPQRIIVAGRSNVFQLGTTTYRSRPLGGWPERRR